MLAKPRPLKVHIMSVLCKTKYHYPVSCSHPRIHFHVQLCPFQVLTTAYSIGYVSLEQVLARSLPAASMVNKYGTVVAATASATAFAARDKGAVMDPVLNYAIVADSVAPPSWPIAGLTYFVLRTKHHIGDCARRQKAITFLYNFYLSASVGVAATALGFSALPNYLCKSQSTLMMNTVSQFTFYPYMTNILLNVLTLISFPSTIYIV
jgi:PBP superfamily domain